MEAGKQTGLLLRVIDNGRGLPSSPTLGRGLRNLEERAASLGGSFSASPASHGGTVIEWWVPLEE